MIMVRDYPTAVAAVRTAPRDAAMRWLSDEEINDIPASAHQAGIAIEGDDPWESRRVTMM